MLLLNEIEEVADATKDGIMDFGHRAWTPEEVIEAVFERAREYGRQQLTAQEMERALEPRQLDRLVKAGKLRKGSQGYWLPQPADPGFLAVAQPKISNRQRKR